MNLAIYIPTPPTPELKKRIHSKYQHQWWLPTLARTPELPSKLHPLPHSGLYLKGLSVLQLCRPPTPLLPLWVSADNSPSYSTAKWKSLDENALIFPPSNAQYDRHLHLLCPSFLSQWRKCLSSYQRSIPLSLNLSCPSSHNPVSVLPFPAKLLIRGRLTYTVSLFSPSIHCLSHSSLASNLLKPLKPQVKSQTISICQNYWTTLSSSQMAVQWHQTQLTTVFCSKDSGLLISSQLSSSSSSVCL